MPNTKLEYMYRDADNYKVWRQVVLEGEISAEDMRKIGENLYDGEFFVPSAVGLDDLQSELGDWDWQSDHPFHTIESIHSTDEPPSGCAPSAAKFVERMKSRTREDWEKAGVAFEPAL